MRKFPTTRCSSCPTSKKSSGASTATARGACCEYRIPEHHIEILREIDGNPTQSSHFLRFAEPVEGLDRQHAALAFELEPLAGNGPTDASGPFAERFRIVPAEHGRVAVFFTAAKETSNLRFHLHAPFVPELSRSSIKDTPANVPLFRQLAGLAARSLHSIRALGLLDRDFLAVLPNRQDAIPDAYRPICDAIVDEMNRHPLTPMHSGGHGPAGRLLQAEAGLKPLLDRDDLRVLRDGDNEPRDWAVAATRRNSEVDRFLNDLDIEHWGVEQLVATIEERLSTKRRYSYATHTWRHGPDRPFLDWMRRKPFDWHRALYALFHRELEDDLDRFDRVCIVRRSDGEYGTGDECYFPTLETREDPIHPRVAEATYTGGGSRTEQAGARAFLEGIGVREVGEYQQIEAILERRYADPSRVPPRHIHEADLKRFIALVQKDRSASDLFEDYFILQRADGLWSKPGGLYLDTPYAETGLHAYYGKLGAESGRAALSDSYDIPDLVSFACMCGAADRLEISKVSCDSNPERRHFARRPRLNSRPQPAWISITPFRDSRHYSKRPTLFCPVLSGTPFATGRETSTS